MEFHGTSTTATNSTRPGTPDSDPIERAQRSNPFATPYGSMPPSAMGSSTGIQTMQPPRYFHSRRINKNEIEKPWLDKKDPKEKWTTIIPLIGLFAGLVVSAYLIWDGLQTVHNYTYCVVMDEDFSSGVLSSDWTKEVQSGGYGTGEFEVTTDTDENVFIKDGVLWIQPTIQDAELVEADNTVNLIKQGICSSTLWSDCVASTNTTNGTIVNPAKSGRITTSKSKAIKFGKIEVEAQLPAGDWLWPAIWMLPTDSVYGVWPRSGEIDIMESRGNNYTYKDGGNNVMSSTLHWGPDSGDDRYWKTDVKNQALHTTYADGYHTYGVEWSTKYIFTYIDSRLLQVLYVTFNEPFWNKGDFSSAYANGSQLTDPWPADSNNAPFNQDFYLILNVAVGGTNGWFADGVDNKPWVDSSSTAPLEFWQARDQWYPTWENQQSAMKVKSVKMWQQKGWNGC